MLIAIHRYMCLCVYIYVCVCVCVCMTHISINMEQASVGYGIPAELFHFLKDDAVKGLHSIYQQIGKSAVATGQEKVSFHSNPKERQCQRMFKLPHNCAHFTFEQGKAQNPSS